MSRGPVVQKLDGLRGDRLGIIERNKHPAFLVQELHRMQIRRGNDGFPRAQRVGERAGNHLAFVFIGRDIDVGTADQFHQLLRTHETVSKYDATFYSNILRQFLCSEFRYFSPSFRSTCGWVTPEIMYTTLLCRDRISGNA